MSSEVLKKAIQIVTRGNQAKFARLLSEHTGEDVRQQYVNYWLRNNGCIPHYAGPISELTNYKVTPEQLCPTFNWPKQKDQAA